MKTDLGELIGELESDGNRFNGTSEKKDSLARLACYHGVVTRLPSSAFGPEQQRNQVKALRNLSHLTRILALFRENEIPVLVVKGLALAVRLYGDVGKRHAGDVDLWIAEDQVEKVHGILVSHGHIAKTGYAELSETYRSEYRKRKFHVGYTHGDSGVSVEIHWRLGGTEETFPLTFEEALERKRSLSVGAVEIPTLDDGDHLLFLYIHAARHLWERLFWLCDIVDFHQPADGPSTESLLARAREWGIDRPVLATWKIAEEVLSFEPEVVDAESGGDGKVRRLAEWGRNHLFRSRRGLDPLTNLKATLLLHRAWSHKRNVLLEFVTAADDWYRLPLPPGFAWVYILARPWFWIQRKISTRRN